jgi:hypothetical protein
VSYLRPVNPTGICSWLTHKHRVPPSQEAGVDYYCPIGTPIRAAANGRVVSVAGNISAATGRFITIDLDDGRRVRYLHLSQWLVKTGDRVFRGQIIALSGASGYGSEFFGGSSLATIPANTGGPHVHTTLWPTHAYSFGTNASTLDLELYTEKSPFATGGAVPLPIAEEEAEENDMRLMDAKDRGFALYGPGYFHSLTGPEGAVLTGVGGIKSLTVKPEEFDLIRAACTRGDANFRPPVTVISSDVWVHQIGEPGPGSAAAFLHQTRNLVLALVDKAGVDVDEVALAASLMKDLTPLLADNLRGVSDADIAKLAKAAADESDRRERERLSQAAQ